jgi:hypothetical protein
LPYWEFRLDKHGWRETPLSEISRGRRTNLSVEYQSVIGRSHITVAERNAANADTRIDKLYLEVVKTYSGFICGNQVRITQ